MHAEEMGGRARKVGTRRERVGIPDKPWADPGLRLRLAAGERRRPWVSRSREHGGDAAAGGSGRST